MTTPVYADGLGPDHHRSLADKILGRWYETPKPHRFVSGHGRWPDTPWRAVTSLGTFLGAKILHRYGAPVPWLPYSAIRWLDHTLTRQMRVLEVGSGSSTRYFAQRVQSVVSVERDPMWRARTQAEVAALPVTLRDAIPEDDGTRYDLILLDDWPRDIGFWSLHQRVQDGGWLVVDNWDWPIYDRIRQGITPTHVFCDFAPYSFAVSETAIFRVAH